MMIKIYTVTEAQNSILKRKGFLDLEVPESVQAGINKVFGQELAPETAVATLLADVRKKGDEAIRYWTKRIEGFDLQDLIIDNAEIQSALSRTPVELLESLQLSSSRIRRFHSFQTVPNWTTEEMGGTLGQRFSPIERAGVYVPGGTAPLPSSLLMSVIPAQVAGVTHIAVATPPGKPDGRVPEIILAAAAIAGIDTLYLAGGALAVAAFAFGTETIPRVDKIVGPGNLFTTLAKRQVYGHVGIDGLYGPTETMVVADDTANPEWVAADMLAQAEHDVLASAILLTPSRKLAEAVQVEVARQMEDLSRAEIIAVSLAHSGGIVITADLDEACRLAGTYAAEHTCLAVKEPGQWIGKIKNAGGLFAGEYSFEVLGDYVTGPSHVMPTGGSARFSSPLNVLDFLKITSIIQLDPVTATRLSPHAERIAQAEQLTAHASAASKRTLKIMMKKEMIQSSFKEFIRSDIRDMEPYVPIVPFEVLSDQLGRSPDNITKLDANENPYGPAPAALEAIASGRWFHIYPDPEAGALREALSSYLIVPQDRLLAGMGADELIDLILRAVISPGDMVVNCPPSFGMYPFSTAVNGGQVLTVPRRDDFSLDIDLIFSTFAAHPQARVLFICSPNNPDGSTISEDDLTRLVELPLLLVLDEAYIEFALAGGQKSPYQWALQYDNLVVLRTFSKLAGLAGLRIGYGIFPEWLLPHLWKIKHPYNVNVAASLAAIASLKNPQWMEEKVKLIVQERERMVQELASFEFLRPYPSYANFVLFKVEGRSAARLKLDLAQEGVLVRYFDKPGLANCIRISAGRPLDTDRLVVALNKVA
jgi:histidinol-phosphate aminotransferase